MNKWKCAAVCEALIIGTLLVVFLVKTDVFGGLIAPDYSTVNEIISWPKEKEPFAKSNWNYNEREQLYMSFQRECDLVCFGDSITQKFEWGDAFPDWRVANRGIGSDTTEGMLTRVDSVVALSPKVISIMAGINDISMKRATDEIIRTYRELLLAVKTSLPDTYIIVTSVLPVSEAHPIESNDIVELNMQLKLLCNELGVIYLDLFDEFADEKENLCSEYAIDNVHLTTQGYLLWLSHLASALNQLNLSK